MEPASQYKTFDIELKADQEGSLEGAFVARIATLGEIDHDSDVTLPGAFPTGATLSVSSYNHSSALGNVLPVGFATLREDSGFVYAEGQLNLKSALGRETYEAIKFSKENGVKTEWSYGYITTKSSFGMKDGQQVRFLEALDVFEVSPVLKGAGLNTSTVALKAFQSFQDESGAALAAVSELLSRGKALAALRAKDGRVLSKGNVDRLKEIQEELQELAADLDVLVDAPAPDSESDDGEQADIGKSLLLRYQFQRAKMHLGI